MRERKIFLHGLMDHLVEGEFYRGSPKFADISLPSDFSTIGPSDFFYDCTCCIQ